jgi:hypothetical protein
VWSAPVDYMRLRLFEKELISGSVHLFLSGHFGKLRSGSLGDWLKGIGEIPGQ